jgi:hypothetical protein
MNVIATLPYLSLDSDSIGQDGLKVSHIEVLAVSLQFNQVSIASDALRQLIDTMGSSSSINPLDRDMLLLLRSDINVYASFVYFPHHSSDHMHSLAAITITKWFQMSMSERTRLLVEAICLQVDEDQSQSIVTLCESMIRPLRDFYREVTATFGSAGYTKYLQLALKFLQDELRNSQVVSSFAQPLLIELQSSLTIRSSSVIQESVEAFDDRLSNDFYAVLTKLSCGLDILVSLVKASSPTIPENDRCICSTNAMVNLVVSSLLHYGTFSLRKNIDCSEEVSKLWEMMRCTPKKLSDVSNNDAELERILDSIQSALAVFDILLPYTNRQPDITWLASSTMSASALVACHKYIQALKSSPMVKMLADAVQDDDRDPIDRCNYCSKLAIILAMVICSKDRFDIEESRSKSTCLSVMRALQELTVAYTSNVMTASMKQKIIHIFLKSLLLFGGHDLILGIANYINSYRESSGVSEQLASRRQESENSFHDEMMIFILQADDYEAVLNEVLLLSAQEDLNSRSTCTASELLRSKSMLDAIIDSPSADIAFAAAVRHEQALHEFIATICTVTSKSSLSLDLVPLQIRILHPCELAKRIISDSALCEALDQQSTQAGSLAEAISSSQRRKKKTQVDVFDQKELESSSYANLQAAKFGPTPGTRLIQLLCALHPDSEQLHLKVMLLLVSSVVGKGDNFAAYRLGLKILCTYELVKREVDDALVEQIQKQMLLLIGSFDHKYEDLRRDLVQETICHFPIDFLLSQDLWKAEESRLSTRESDPLVAAESMILELTAKALARDDDHADSATIDVVKCLDSYHPIDLDRIISVLNMETDFDRRVEFLNRLRSSFLASYDSSLQVINEAAARAAGGFRITLDMIDKQTDSKVINALKKNGFSVNGARRSLAAILYKTRETIDQEVLISSSLRWAIEHSQDPDFDNPFTYKTDGALLTESKALELNARKKAIALEACITMIDHIGRIACSDVWESYASPVRAASLIHASDMQSEQEDKKYSQISKLRGALEVAEDYIGYIAKTKESRMKMLVAMSSSEIAIALISSSENRATAIIAMKNVILLLSRAQDDGAFAFVDALIRHLPEAILSELSESFVEEHESQTELHAAASLSAHDAIVWQAASTRFQHLLDICNAQEINDSLRYVHEVLLKDRQRYLQLLSCIHRSSSLSITSLILLKQQAYDVLDRSMGEDEPWLYQILGGGSSKEEVMKQLTEDIATLHRISRIPNMHDLDFRRLFSDSLLSALTPSTSKQRFEALSTLIPHLQPANVVLWHRAIGRAHGLSLADLYYYSCISQLNSLLVSTGNNNRNQDAAIEDVLACCSHIEQSQLLPLVYAIAGLHTSASTDTIQDLVTLLKDMANNTSLAIRLLSAMDRCEAFPTNTASTKTTKASEKTFRISAGSVTSTRRTTSLRATKLTADADEADSPQDVSAADHNHQDENSIKQLLKDLLRFLSSIERLPASLQQQARMQYHRKETDHPDQQPQETSASSSPAPLPSNDAKGVDKWQRSTFHSALHDASIQAEEIVKMFAPLDSQTIITICSDEFQTRIRSEASDDKLSQSSQLLDRLQACLLEELWDGFVKEAVASLKRYVQIEQLQQSDAIYIAAIYLRLRRVHEAVCTIPREDLPLLASPYIVQVIHGCATEHQQSIRDIFVAESGNGLVAASSSILSYYQSIGSRPIDLAQVKSLVQLLRLACMENLATVSTMLFNHSYLHELVFAEDDQPSPLDEQWLCLVRWLMESVNVKEAKELLQDIMLVDLHVHRHPVLQQRLRDVFGEQLSGSIELQLLCGTIPVEQVADSLLDVIALKASDEDIDILLITVFLCYSSSMDVVVTHCLRRDRLHRLLLQRSMVNFQRRLEQGFAESDPLARSLVDGISAGTPHRLLRETLAKHRVLPLCLSPLFLALEMLAAGHCVEGMQLFFSGNMITFYPIAADADMLPRLTAYSESAEIPYSYDASVSEASSQRWGWRRYRELCERAKQTIL